MLGTYWVFCIGILMNIHSLYMFLVSFPGIILKHSFHKVLASVLCLVSFSLNYLIYFSCLHWHFFLFSIFTEFQILVRHSACAPGNSDSTFLKQSSFSQYPWNKENIFLYSQITTLSIYLTVSHTLTLIWSVSDSTSFSLKSNP